jgi:hypothetical protein
MSDLPTQASAVPIDELASALDQQTASKINGDAVQEDGAFVHAENKYEAEFQGIAEHQVIKGGIVTKVIMDAVHAENKYEAEFQGDQPLQMAFKTRNDDGKHVVIKVIKGGIAEQQGVRVGHQLVAFGGKSFEGMSEQQVTREIKESKSTGKLEFIRLKGDGGVDLSGAPAAAGDGKHEQRQEAAEKPLTEAEKKLLKAVEEGKLQEVKDALNDGVRVDAADKDGETPMLKAAMRGHKEMVGMLIERGANVNAVDKDYGMAPLCWAAGEGHKEIVGMLIEGGAGVNAASKNGDTPLCCAAERGHKEIAEMLIERG